MRRSPVDHARATPGRIASIFPALLLSGLILICPRGVDAQTWNGNVSDYWGDANNWSPATVPNSPSATVTINNATNNPVLINNGFTIGDLTLSTSSNAVTIQSGGDFLAMDGSGGSTISNAGSILLNGGGGSGGNPIAYLELDTNTALSGGGTLTLSVASGGGTAVITQAVSGLTLTNSSTIQGTGIIGVGTGIIGANGLSLVNQSGGTVNANVSSSALLLNGGPITNAGLLVANGGGILQSGGILQIDGITVNNAGGNITANSGSTVQLYAGTDIQGGTLTNNGGTLGTVAGSTAVLDGSTKGPLIINGTYTADTGSRTTLLGTITNNGTIQVNGGSGTNAILELLANTALSGGGTLTLSTASGGGTAYIYQTVSGVTLTNGNNTIQGAGIIGYNDLSLVNEVGGTILANSPGQTLLLNGGGNVTNNGTFQANSGSTLFVDTTLTNYNPATSTLTGGTYNAFSGTIQLSQANATAATPAVIATNAATVLLDGATATIADGSGNDIVRGFLATNTAAGSFTIQNGANLTTAATGFSNAGFVTIGANSTFTVGGSNDYVQTGGTTTLGASSSILAVASGHSVDINGGTLQGFGTINGNLTNSGGTVMPGLSGVAGVLTVTGNYTDPPSSHLFIQIGGPNAGNGVGFYSQLDVGGTANLNNGTLDLSLINGFTPTDGELFTILTSSGLSGMFNDNIIHEGNVTWTVEYSPSGLVLDASVSSPVVPEPASWLMLGLGLTAVGTCVVRKSKSQVRGK